MNLREPTSILSVRIREIRGHQLLELAYSPPNSHVLIERYWRLCSGSKHRVIDHAPDGPSDQWRHPEHPQLLQSPPTREYRWPGTARRVYGSIGHGNTDQVNQRQAEPDRDGSESLATNPASSE